MATHRSKPGRKSPSTPREPVASPAALPATPPEGWVGLTRDQLGLSLQAATTCLRGLEAMRKAQWDMTHLALKRYEELQQRLQQATAYGDLMALQAEAMRFDSALAIKSARDLYDAAVEGATEALNQARANIDSSQSDGIKTWLQSMQTMMHTGVRPLDDVFGHALLRDLMIPPASTPAPDTPRS